MKNGSSTASTSGSSGISDGVTIVTIGAETRLSPSPTRPCMVEPSSTTKARSATMPALYPRTTPGQPARKENRTCRSGLSTLRSTRQMLCQVPRARRPSSTGTVAYGGTSAGITCDRP